MARKPTTKTPSVEPKTKDERSEHPSSLSKYKLDRKVMRDSIGRYRTVSLFEKGNTTTDQPPLFTLEDYDTSLPSFKRMYVEIHDPSEYSVAMLLLGSYDHWTRLCECAWFKPILKECREELDAKIRAMAISQIITDGKVAFSEATRLAANKFLAAGGYLVEAEKEVQKETAKRGRPSKEEIERRTKEILTEEALINADYQRMSNSNSTQQSKQHS